MTVWTLRIFSEFPAPKEIMTWDMGNFSYLSSPVQLLGLVLFTQCRFTWILYVFLLHWQSCVLCTLLLYHALETDILRFYSLLPYHKSARYLFYYSASQTFSGLRPLQHRRHFWRPQKMFSLNWNRRLQLVPWTFPLPPEEKAASPAVGNSW